MKITTQEKLAEAIDAIFKEGVLEINNLIFKQLYFLKSEIKNQFLQAIYQDSLTADYSFEQWNMKTSNVLELFINASIEKQKAHFLVFDINNDFLGRCILRVNAEQIHFGYALCANKQNQGLGTRILQTLFDICFKNLQLNQDIYGSTMSHNIPSQKTMEKVGMISDGCLEKSIKMALDTRWLRYKINLEIYKSHIPGKAHPNSRMLREVILDDYRTTIKQNRLYDASEFGRIKFFLKKEVYLASDEVNISKAHNCI